MWRIRSGSHVLASSALWIATRSATRPSAARATGIGRANREPKVCSIVDIFVRPSCPVMTSEPQFRMRSDFPSRIQSPHSFDLIAAHIIGLERHDRPRVFVASPDRNLHG